MKLGIVVQRYGLTIEGGAENHARLLAEWLQSHTDWEIQVLTTCAEDFQTWKNTFPLGKSIVNNVSVHRFRTTTLRQKWTYRLMRFLHLCIPRKIILLSHILDLIERKWIEAQGPHSPELIEAIETNSLDTDALLFFTYLYYPTIEGLLKAPVPSLVIPTAHKEPALYLKRTREALRRAKALLANTSVEAELLSTIDKNLTIYTGAIGLDIDFEKNDSKSASPYLLYLGRIGPSKNIPTLIEYVSNLNSQGKNMTLKLAGALESGFELPNAKGIEFLGFVSEEEKNQLIQNSLAVVNPSDKESLSMIALEAFVRRKPGLFNTRCPVLKGYVDTLDTAYGFDNFESFCAALETIKNESQTPDYDEKLASTQKWVVQKFSWNTVKSNIEKALDYF